MNKAKLYHVDGKYYTITELVALTGRVASTIRYKLKQGYNLYEMKHSIRKPKTTDKVAVNWKGSMMNDKLGYWKLFNKVNRRLSLPLKATDTVGLPLKEMIL